MSRLKLSKKKLLIFIILAPFFKPTYFETISSIKILYDVLFCIDLVAAVYLILVKRLKLCGVSKNIIAFSLITFVVTMINTGFNNYMFLTLFSVIMICVFIDEYKDSFCQLIDCLLLHCEICIYVNLFTLILFRERLYGRPSTVYGLTHEWFLGTHNGFIYWMIPALMVALICYYVFNRKKRSALLILSIIITLLLKSSATAIVGVGIVVLSAVIPKFRKVFTVRRTIFLFTVIFVLVVVLQKADIFAPLVTGILNKDMTFSNRLIIWKSAMEAIINRPLFGYGYLSNDDMVSYLNYRAATHCHNQILQVAFQGGLLSLGLYIVAQIKSFISAWRVRNKDLARLLIAVLFSYNLVGITENLNNALLYLVLVLPVAVMKYTEKDVNQNELS